MKLPSLPKALTFALCAFSALPSFGVTASSLSSFGGIEEPTVTYNPNTNAFTNDSYVNITDQGAGTFRMMLRFRNGQWWDGDRDTTSNDRGRAEVKVLGPRQLKGQTFEYRSTWRTNSSFVTGGRFCHITQVKGYGAGDIGAPLVTQSIDSNTVTAVSYCSGTNSGLTDVRTFNWAPATWKTVAFRLRISSTDGANDGMLVASVNGDAFTGVNNTHMYRTGAPEYQPKWGLYRGQSNGMPIGDDYLEHQNVQATQITATTPTVSAPGFSPGGGTYATAQTVTITTATSGATIRYTVDGSTPSSSVGTVYTGPVTISSSRTLKAIAYQAGSNNSSVTSATYTITSLSPVVFEAESATRTTSGTAATTDTDASASGGARVTLNSTGTGSWVEFTTPSIPAGTYTLGMSYKTNNNRGILNLKVDGVQIGGTLDQYASTASYPTRTFGTVTFTTAGTHKIRLTVTGKNGSSSSYTLSADKFTLTP